jgi:hypothetical protein
MQRMGRVHMQHDDPGRWAESVYASGHHAYGHGALTPQISSIPPPAPRGFLYQDQERNTPPDWRSGKQGLQGARMLIKEERDWWQTRSAGYKVNDIEVLRPWS